MPRRGSRYPRPVTTRLLLAAGFVAVALVVALVLDRRRPEPPSRGSYPVPAQIDRDDFPGTDRSWLVALFSSRTCDSCTTMAAKVAVLESADVAVCDVAFQDAPDLHERYDIAGVPLVVVADAEGVVRASFVGPATATDLWAAVAEARVPGSRPAPECGSRA